MSSLSENNNIFQPYQTSGLEVESNEAAAAPALAERVNEIWTKSSFTNNRLDQRVDLTLNLDNTKMSWLYQERSMEDVMMEAVKEDEEEEEGDGGEEKVEVEAKRPATPVEGEAASPSHHARRPMNAFLIFCKKHRPIVRIKYPNLENRGVTKILGEWWALLGAEDKGSYTKLAKEYKDAFFSANPNFKWYKLPAPPLRMLQVRPTNHKQESSPPTSPTNVSSPTSEFTPGKLADESQLGSLSSLLNAGGNYNSRPNEIYNKYNNNNNNKEDYAVSLESSPMTTSVCTEMPPKPVKKRYVDGCADTKGITRNLFEDEPNMTVKDGDDANGFKDTRKSVRKGKGNRYEELMKTGKLLKSKRDRRDSDVPKLDLNNTIKRLEERILPKAEEDAETGNRERTTSEMSESDDYSKAIPSFNLDQRISELPTLSYEEYVSRKKESKKRKFVKSKHDVKVKSEGLNRSHPIGSKKRKNKHNITHLEKPAGFNTGFDNDLSGLTTLAEIAANKEKIVDST